MPGPSDLDLDVDALVAAAMKGSGLCWLTVGARAARPAWHVWDGERAYVVHARTDDASEQPVPGLADADRVAVVVRGDKDGRVVTWHADVTHLRPGTPEWDEAVELLRGARLNERDPDTVPERWAATCAIAVLAPDGTLAEAPGRYEQDDHAAAPPPSPATTVTAKPYVLGRRARRRPRL